MLFLRAKKIFKTFLFVAIGASQNAHASVEKPTLVMLPLSNKEALFPEIIAPINFLVPVTTRGILPLNDPVEINASSSYVVLDITNTLVLLDEVYVDVIIQKLGIEKKIVSRCHAQDLLQNNIYLYHPTSTVSIPLVACESYKSLLDTIIESGNFSIEKKLVIIITSFKNKDWYKKNLDSIFMQNYTNYRMIYIDDYSPDSTGKLVQAYIKELGQEYRTTLVLQPEWKSQMANHYYGVYMCDDDEIVCHLDGDDWLHDEDVLTTINEIYLNNDVWITYGLPLDSTGGRPPRASDEVMQKVMQRNTYRSEGCWAFSHFRTFYAWLFKSLKLQDLVYKGNFANMAPAPDVAMMYPMLEMSGHHNKLIDRDVYVVNKKNPISQCNITPYQVISELDRTIKSTWPTYEPFYRPVINRIAQFENKTADLVMWTENLSLELSAALDAARSHLSHLNKVIIIYDKSRNSEKNLFEFRKSFPDCLFLDFDPQNTHFKSLLEYVLELTDGYIIFTCPDFIIDQDRDISYCIKELERTFTYGFYLHLEYSDELKKLHAPLSDEVIAWQPAYTKQIWPAPNALGMILYRKKDIEALVKNINCKTIGQFKELWAQQQMPERAVGLFYKY